MTVQGKTKRKYWFMKDIFNDIMAPAGAEVSIIPVMQGDSMPHIDQEQLPDTLPILALRNAVLFPGTVYPITIGREKSIRLIEDAERTNSFIGAVPQNDLSVEDPRKEDLYNYGTVAKIVKTLEMPDGTITAILQGCKRFEVEAVFEYNPYLLGRVRYVEDIVPEEDTKARMIAESLKEKASAIIKSSTFVPREAAAALKGIDNFNSCLDFVGDVLTV
jgi:ATP-dependent Lon protease